MADASYDVADETLRRAGDMSLLNEEPPRLATLADVDALKLSSTARALLRWGGYEAHPDETDELVDAGLVRWCPRFRAYLLTADGGDAFVLLGGGR